MAVERKRAGSKFDGGAVGMGAATPREQCRVDEIMWRKEDMQRARMEAGCNKTSPPPNVLSQSPECNPKPILNELNSLQNCVDRLECIVEDLVRKMAFILSPVPTQEQCGPTSTSGDSELANYLRERNIRLNVVADLIVRLMGLMEL